MDQGTWKGIKDTQKQRIILILIMTGVAMVMTFTAISLLYQTAYEEEKSRLVEVAQSQARLMEAVARFDMQYSHNYPEGTEAATLSQFIEAHKKFEGFGTTGEFLLARKKDQTIEFILSHRHSDLRIPQSLPLDSPLGLPMHRALEGQSGTMVGPDYRNVKVLAAYEPIKILNLGLVAKIDLEEIRKPFYKAGFITLAIACAVILVGILLFWRFTNPMVEEITASRGQLRNLAQRIQTIREEEKGRISRAVHDELGQQLTAIQLELNYLEEELETGMESQQKKESFQCIGTMVDNTIQAVQRISTELRPQILDVFGLGEAILWQTNEYQKRTGIHFECSGVDDKVPLSKEKAITMFRVFQETLTNIFRHAKANLVIIHLYRDNGNTILKVRDNGIGISSEKINSAKSIGLLGIRERLLVWGGTVHIESKPGSGTTVIAKIPAGDL
ncbi:MAG: histidine kinase [Nitrospinota bacterium]|nr:histidine kinase [Nitrospinota bacterium]